MKARTTPEGVRWLRHDFPLRPDFVVTIELPYNMSSREAQRLAAFILALAPEGTADSNRETDNG